jgi:hypothetical protein
LWRQANGLSDFSVPCRQQTVVEHHATSGMVVWEGSKGRKSRSNPKTIKWPPAVPSGAELTFPVPVDRDGSGTHVYVRVVPGSEHRARSGGGDDRRAMSRTSWDFALSAEGYTQHTRTDQSCETSGNNMTLVRWLVRWLVGSFARRLVGPRVGWI